MILLEDHSTIIRGEPVLSTASAARSKLPNRHPDREIRQVCPLPTATRPQLILERRPGHTDQAFVDFDGVRFMLHTPEKKTRLVLSMEWRCWSELVHLRPRELAGRLV